MSITHIIHITHITPTTHIAPTSPITPITQAMLLTWRPHAKLTMSMI